MIVNDHPFLNVNKRYATNHLSLRRNIFNYFETRNRVQVPEHIHVSIDCATLLGAFLVLNPKNRISFEDFFASRFLLPSSHNESNYEPSFISFPLLCARI